LIRAVSACGSNVTRGTDRVFRRGTHPASSWAVGWTRCVAGAPEGSGAAAIEIRRRTLSRADESSKRSSSWGRFGLDGFVSGVAAGFSSPRGTVRGSGGDGAFGSAGVASGLSMVISGSAGSGGAGSGAGVVGTGRAGTRVGGAARLRSSCSSRSSIASGAGSAAASGSRDSSFAPGTAERGGLTGVATDSADAVTTPCPGHRRHWVP